MTVQLERADRSEPGPEGSLATRAYQVIKDRLIMLDIRPGEPINDVGLAGELGVGRTPVREALKRLETDHLVVTYPRRGTFATVVDFSELGSISEIRRLLEPYAARRAAESASPAVRAELRAAALDVAEITLADGARATFLRQDMAIHRLIYRAAGNPHLEEVLIRYDNLATRIWCLVIDKLPDLAHHVREHTHVLGAIADGDADRAADLALHHVTSFEQEIRRVL